MIHIIGYVERKALINHRSYIFHEYNICGIYISPLRFEWSRDHGSDVKYTEPKWTFTNYSHSGY